MCVAIYKPKNATVDFDKLEACHDTNPDGMGFAVVVDNKILIHKQLDDFTSFFDLVNRYQNDDMLLHFRIKTHGKIDRSNCHPFLLANKSVGFAHNGILSKYTPNAKSKVSDTVIFRKTMLEPLVQQYPDAIFEDKLIIQLLGEAIGTNNKLVLLDRKGNHSIINEEEGETIKGVWYSNTHWQFSDFGTPVRLFSGHTGQYRGSKSSRYRSSYSRYKPESEIVESMTAFPSDYHDAMWPAIKSICDQCQCNFDDASVALDGLCDNCHEDLITASTSQFD